MPAASSHTVRRRFFAVFDRLHVTANFQRALMAMMMVIELPQSPTTKVSSFRIALEHRVTAEEAMTSALGIVPELMVNPGCKECSKSNETYCLGEDVIYDHCCCDRRFHENIPYVEHSCYIESTPCEPIVRDCGEYMKMMSCCCHRLLGTKWKNISMSLAGGRKQSASLLVLSATFIIVCCFKKVVLEV